MEDEGRGATVLPGTVDEGLGAKTPGENPGRLLPDGVDVVADGDDSVGTDAVADGWEGSWTVGDTAPEGPCEDVGARLGG